ncbi:AI-2E family transporter [Candidatus Woesearchaeota archaeon]|nr:AI-2E family transporter [Candidatus Woesearchaeota archaeon]
MIIIQNDVHAPKPRNHTKHFFWICFFAILVLAFFVIKPYFRAILTGIVVAYIFYPVYDKLQRYLGMPNFSAFLATVLIFVLVSIPLTIFFYSISGDITTFYLLAKQKLLSGELFGEAPCVEGFLCTLNNNIKAFLSNQQIVFYVNNALTHAASFVLDYTSSIFLSIPRFVLKLFIFIFVLFYSFRDGKNVMLWLKDILPLKPHFKEDLIQRSQDVIFATVYGIIIIALVQGIVGTIGFLIFDVPSPIFLGLLLTFAALIPFVGTAIVWLPASLIVLINGYLNADSTMIGKGIGLLLYGTFIISLVDNLIKPRVISKEAKLHPVLVIIGLFGGLRFLGPIGVIVGPLVLALLVSFIDIYKRDRHEISG